MAKVIVERPRYGHRHGHIPLGRPTALLDDDDAPLGPRARLHPRAKKTKTLNENLAPLRRYLAAQTGRRWDAIYAAISERLAPSSTVQQHVRDHLRDFVAVNVVRENGTLIVRDTRWGKPIPLAESFKRFYVDPRCGRLFANPDYRGWNARRRQEKAHAAAETALRMRIIDPNRQLHRLDDGEWYDVQLARAPGEQPDRYGWVSTIAANDALDVVLKAGLSHRPRPELYGRPGLIAIGKRQISGKEKRKAGL
jgi:hypothetical protein